MGEHDVATASEIEKALAGAVGSVATTVVVDLTETTFVDSTVLELLVRTRARLAHTRRLAVVCDDPMILRVFEIAGLDRLFDFRASRCAVQESA